ncbi:uncharacterized protein LACBIDRAFT_327527 [Laccaria bicolor S238N-H82]|uniref:Predicted protein n=1 Tax=Laccaria bicolor (strain S238N-H82 / ATCC MYA-4686) TaxID=486041 RepID=B0DC07_LACBS|nr:uncharacterized protein LACBIDRAFT_327527 [Laccaria bicolor S238N-H82]EDR07649.1 predicted protein [Laccaria bicolor S238N-H82]|eukprot:XP_001881438.1 predicted protein [Laccaria bicolor S238N-H82]
MYWTVISTRNRVDCMFFHVFSEFLVGAPKFWAEILETARTASWPVIFSLYQGSGLSLAVTKRGHKNKRGLIVRDCTCGRKEQRCQQLDSRLMWRTLDERFAFRVRLNDVEKENVLYIDSSAVISIDGLSLRTGNAFQTSLAVF